MLQAETIGEPALVSVRVLLSQGRAEDALVSLGGVIRQYPTWALPWIVVASILSSQSRFVEALDAAQQAVALEPANVIAQQLLTGLQLQLNHAGPAREAALRLVALAPHRPESYAFLAFAEAFAGNDKEAMVASRKCKRLAPGRGIGHQALAVTHLTFQRFAKAERHAMAALAVDGPIASIFHDLGVALWEQGKFAGARRAFDRAVALDHRFLPSLSRFDAVGPTFKESVPALVALAAGLSVMFLTQMPSAFLGVGVVGVLAMFIAARAAGPSLGAWGHHLRPALALVLLFDVAAIAYHAGVFQ